LIVQGKVLEIERENTRGRPLSPLLVAVVPGIRPPQPKMVRTERDDRIRQAYFVQGKAIRQIARKFHHDRDLVRRIVREEKHTALSGCQEREILAAPE
jgi:DNA invertase Pin-like site-specific DNA recombinase